MVVCPLEAKGGRRPPLGGFLKTLSSSEPGFLLNELCCLQPLPAAPFSLASPAAPLGLSPAQERRQDQTVASSTRTRGGKALLATLLTWVLGQAGRGGAQERLSERRGKRTPVLVLTVLLPPPVEAVRTSDFSCSGFLT